MKKAGRVKPKDVVEIMSKNNCDISLNEAANILDFMRKFAILAIDQALKK
ncbi:hypothetical protein [Roseivirga seohaensis]|jgi:hypothetical protein|nr:hypothetical protein [Roseivirga seohaensis]|tara:strand:+ start:1213 stop:1362 length:150 start_codon:yes stop_codon:yes gene_type:complete